ncbi:MAG: hypothetical protein GXO96_11495 [Nitrospirae bacterium]|nr:hypothetical protein [Candidatus Manganitrophaceae bacterium]
MKLQKPVYTKRKQIPRVLHFFGTFVLAIFILFPSSVFPATLPEIEEIKQLYQAGQYNNVVTALGETGDWDAAQSLYLGLSHRAWAIR